MSHVIDADAGASGEESPARPGGAAGVVRRLLAHAGLAALSVILCLCAVEIALRVTEPREIMRYFFVSPDATLHHRFIPGATGRYQSTEFNTSYTINSLGLRDREIGPREPGTIRILMLGDSFTEGDGVEAGETFSKRLEAMLNPPGRPRGVEVVNAGVGSYSPLLEYLYLTHGGLALHPDCVILNYDLSDAYDDITYSALGRFGPDGKPLGVAAPDEAGSGKGVLVGIKDFFKDHTRLYNFVRVRIERYLEGIRHEGNFSGDLHYDKYAMLRGNYRPGVDDWTLSERYLLMIRDTLSALHIDYRVNVYPYGMQVSPKEWAVGRQFWGFRPDTLYSTWPQDLIARFCAENGISVTNMCQAFRDTSRSVFPLYLRDNGHWTARGQLVAAELFAQVVGPYVADKLGGGPLARNGSAAGHTP